MSEQLLTQQVGVIYWLWREAIMQNAQGESYEALKTLSYVTDTLYDNGKDYADLNCVDEVLNKIKAKEAFITTSESQAREARITETRNLEASREFRGCLRKVRNYMQVTGYYLMMNKGWDNRIIPTATMKPQVDPPRTKTYLEKMPSEIL